MEVHVPAEPLSTPVGKTAELTCTYSTSVTDSFALEWSFVQPGKPISASQPVSWEWGWGALACGQVGLERQERGPAQGEGARRMHWGISIPG